MVNFDCSFWLAPGMDLIRNPLCGRNLEYFSEDPLLNGLTCAAQVSGVESVPGVGVMAKHYAMNNTEYNRTLVVTIAFERTEREIYLKGWEYMVKASQPTGIMSSYNILQGTYTAASYDLLMPGGQHYDVILDAVNWVEPTFLENARIRGGITDA